MSPWATQHRVADVLPAETFVEWALSTVNIQRFGKRFLETGHEGTEGGEAQLYPPSNVALDGGGWSTPQSMYPRQRISIPIFQEDR